VAVGTGNSAFNVLRNGNIVSTGPGREAIAGAAIVSSVGGSSFMQGVTFPLTPINSSARRVPRPTGSPNTRGLQGSTATDLPDNRAARGLSARLTH
jgi:hypothetical protein